MLLRWIALGLLLWLPKACDDWRDPLPGKLTVHTRAGGKPVGCMMQVFNAEGTQLSEEGVNDGVVRLPKLAAGEYTLRFTGHSGQQYPAIVKFKLYEAGELELPAAGHVRTSARRRRSSAPSARPPAR